MNKQSILACAVATVLAVPAYAAIDGDGMAYVSASEGLSGTILVNVFTDTDVEGTDASSKLHEMIIEYNGSSDLGGGMKSLYNVKLLNSNGTGDANPNFKVDQYFLGVSAPFGTVWAGKVAGVTDANVPGGSLDSVAGSNAEALTGSKEGQLRYESPRINGLKLGLSGVLNGADATGADPGTDNPAGSLDEMNLMAHYELPIGLVMALGYETKDRVPGGDTPANTISDKSSGFRFGATYSQDNWTVAYSYRKYNEHGGFVNTYQDGDKTKSKYPHIVVGTGTGTGAGTEFDLRNSSTEYQAHRMAAQFVVDRVTMSANYSTETVSTDVPASYTPTGGSAVSYGDVRNVEVSRTTLGVDAKYSLGAKSWMALGHQNVDTEEYDPKKPIATGDSPVSDKVGTTTLRYGVSF